MLFLPATSLELTLSRFIRDVTFSWSPFLHASKRLDCSLAFGFVAVAISSVSVQTELYSSDQTTKLHRTSWNLCEPRPQTFNGRGQTTCTATIDTAMDWASTVIESRGLLPVTALEFCSFHRSRVLLSGMWST